MLTIEADNISMETMDGPNLSTYTAQIDPQRVTCKKYDQQHFFMNQKLQGLPLLLCGNQGFYLSLFMHFPTPNLARFWR